MSYGDDDGDVTVRGLLGLVLVLVCVLGIFFFFLINTSVFGLLEFSVFGLLLYWGLIFLPATTRRDGIHFSASNMMGSISDSLYFFVFFWLRIRGLAVSELPVMGSPWAWFCYIYIYIFQILVQIFFGFFFFFWLESRTNFK